MSQACSELVGPQDPPAYSLCNAESTAPLLLLCDHASHAVPASLQQLGLPAEQLQRHIGWDIGAACVTERLAEQFDCAAVFAGYSRLVIDCNRAPGDGSSIPECSDGTTVPGNLDLSDAAIAARIDACFWPYHHAITRWLAAARHAGRVPAVVAIHSFTPCMQGFARPWQIGVLWNHDPRMAQALIERLRAAGYCVGDNEPYSGRDTHYTVETHAAAAGLPHVLIEIRQDLLADAAGCRHWAGVLAGALTPILRLPELQHTAFY